MSTISQQIRFFRRLQDIRQYDLAEHLGRSQTWVSLVERGQLVPEFSDLARIADALCVDVLALVGDEEQRDGT